MLHKGGVTIKQIFTCSSFGMRTAWTLHPWPAATIKQVRVVYALRARCVQLFKPPNGLVFTHLCYLMPRLTFEGQIFKEQQARFLTHFNLPDAA